MWFEATPRYIRAMYYRYSFGKEQWWDRKLIGEYLPPLTLEDPEDGAG